LIEGAAIAAAAVLPVGVATAATGMKSSPSRTQSGRTTKSTFTTRDGTQIFYKDWGRGQAIFFHHGWPLSADDWDGQMMFFLQHGYRVLAHDRRGHGRSSQTATGNDMDTYVTDVDELVRALDLRDAIHIGHSTGGGEVARYVARYGQPQGRVAKAVLISAVTPLMLKTANNPNGVPVSVFDEIRAGTAFNRPQYYWDFTLPFYGYNRPGAKVSEGVRQNWWRQGMMGSVLAHTDGIKAFSETDFTDDLKAIDVPTLVLHGEDDQIVPFANSGPKSAKLLKQSTFKAYPGFPHGMPTTNSDQINADLLGFVQAAATAKK
jgi:non-heme chloroperoxidase